MVGTDNYLNVEMAGVQLLHVMNRNILVADIRVSLVSVDPATAAVLIETTVFGKEFSCLQIRFEFREACVVCRSQALLVAAWIVLPMCIMLRFFSSMSDEDWKEQSRVHLGRGVEVCCRYCPMPCTS